MDRRIYPGLVAGVGGLAAGAGATVLGSPALAALAGVAALVAGGAALPARSSPQPTTTRSDELPLVDRATGLPNGAYFALALESRIRTARRRLLPLTLVLIEVVYRREQRPSGEAADAATTAAVLLRVAEDADDVAQLRPGCFAFLLDDAAEARAVALVDLLETSLAAEVAGVERLAAGVAVYPSCALDAAGVIARAEVALDAARSRPAGQRVVVAER